MVENKRIWLSTPTMHGEEQEFIKQAFEDNWITCLGKNCDGFEEDVIHYTGIGYATALSSGTAALHMAVKLAGIKDGDIVLCTDMTFSATANPIIYENGIPVFIDSEPETWNMDPNALEQAFEKYKDIKKPKAVIVVNLYGTPAKLDQIRELCDTYQAVLIEDAAESLGALYLGRQTGTFGVYNVFSFNGNKIITTSGGGMFVSDHCEAVQKVRFWATQARDPAPWYQHSELGYNYRMSNVLAGIGRGQMLHLEEHITLKKNIFRRYQKGFQGLPVDMNPYPAGSEPNFWLSCITVQDNIDVNPMDIIKKLETFHIEARPIWKPMHLQPYYESCDFITACDEPYDEKVFARGLCLPSDIKMSEEEQEYIIRIIREMF